MTFIEEAFRDLLYFLHAAPQNNSATQLGLQKPSKEA